MDVLVTCKYEEDPIKNEGPRVVTTLYSNFSDAQGQITLVLVSVSGRNLNSSKLSCMSSLPARMRMIESKIGPLVAEIFEFENVHRHTDRQTTARLVYYKLTLSLRLR